ncbi:MAG: DUF3467 domain-containing protein [Bacteroidaceae bacterium]|nr:DUF3467 domain-containing protein [Bacteroidaceae bacterium]MDO4800597.1 DUF3467 domain-containing protein [Prevotellaceae bacterium]
MAEQKQQLQIELKPEVASGVYSNMAIIANTSSEFVLDFVSMLPGLQKAEVRSRIIMSPEHAKRLLMALNERVRGYEQQFGEIDLHQPQQQEAGGRTIAPFGRGEA